LAADLTNSTSGAELAVNTADKRLFTKDSGGTVVELGTNPSSLTLSNGTANGVPYLNGSKVLTTGSALTFDGTNLGVGTSSPSAKLQSTASSNQLTISESSSLGATFDYQSSTGNLSIATNGINPRTSPQLVLNLSGNLGLGVTPSARSANFRAFELGRAGNSIQADSTSTSVSLTSNAVYNASSTFVYGANGYASRYEQYNSTHQWYTAPSGTAGNAISFTQSMTLDSSGNLLVGTTSSSGRFTVSESGNPANQTAYIECTNGSFNSRVLSLNASRNATSNEYQFLVCSISGIESKFIIQNSGNAQNRNNSYGAISDVKLKENIVDATPKLDDLLKVKVRHYSFKSTPEEKQIGVVAQELEQIFPSMVEESPDRDAEGNDLGTTTKSVKYSVFVPMLIKAIQEQQAIINDLKARLDAANL
jgi:hypothetical protein